MDSDTKDVFLSHASQDKEAFVRPFAQELEKRRISYWLDEAEIRWGDKITKAINQGLSKARFVIVFLSGNFLGKNWPESELGAALSKENSRGEIVVLPLIIGDADTILSQYPLLREKMYLKWGGPISTIVDHLERLLDRTTPEEAEDDLAIEPTLGDLVYGYMAYSLFRGRFGDDYYDKLSSLDNILYQRGPDTLISNILGEIPDEMRTLVQEFLDDYDQKSRLIRNAISAELPSDGSLEFVSVTTTHDAEFDVMLRNLSDNTVYITKIVLRVLKDRGAVLPILNPSAKYKIPIGSLSIGESRSLDVSHIIEPHKADRFLIALETTRVLLVRLTLEYNKRFSISENVWLWG